MYNKRFMDSERSGRGDTIKVRLTERETRSTCYLFGAHPTRRKLENSYDNYRFVFHNINRRYSTVENRVNLLSGSKYTALPSDTEVHNNRISYFEGFMLLLLLLLFLIIIIMIIIYNRNS